MLEKRILGELGVRLMNPCMCSHRYCNAYLSLHVLLEGGYVCQNHYINIYPLCVFCNDVTAMCNACIQHRLICCVCTICYVITCIRYVLE